MHLPLWLIIDDKEKTLTTKEDVLYFADQWLIENGFIKSDKFFAPGVADYYDLDEETNRFKCLLGLAHLVPDSRKKVAEMLHKNEGEALTKLEDLGLIQIVSRIDDPILREILREAKSGDMVVVVEGNIGYYLNDYLYALKLDNRPIEDLLGKWVVIVDYHI